MERKRNILRVLALIAFLTSSTFTFLSTLNGSKETLDIVLAATMTLTLQGAALFFFYRVTTQCSTALRIFYSALALSLITLSMTDSIDYQAKKENKEINDNYLNSIEFKERESQKAIQEQNRQIALQGLTNNRSDIQTIRNDIRALEGKLDKNIIEIKEPFQKQINSLLKERDGLSAKMTWRKKQIAKEIAIATEKMNKEISKEKERMNKKIENKEKSLKEKEQKIEEGNVVLGVGETKQNNTIET